MGYVFGGIIGQSEANLRSVIQTAVAIPPCVLWIDEIETGFSASKSAFFIDAMHKAYAEGKEPGAKEILTAMSLTVQLAQLMAGQIAGLRHWAKGRAREAVIRTAEESD